MRDEGIFLEEHRTKQRALKLWDSNLLDTFEVGTFKGLQEIHRYLFHAIEGYNAGKIREVNISKKNFRFTSAIYLDEALKAVEKMPESTFEEIIDKYIEMNIAHPFREGNGRATRIWLDQMLKKNLTMCIDWSLINKNDYLNFMELSPTNGKYIRELLHEGLTNEINNREVYMKGIDRSYEYEDEKSKSIFEIDQENKAQE